MTKGHVHLEYVDLPDIVDVAKLGTVIEADRNLLYKPTCKGPKRGKLLEAETTHHPRGDWADGSYNHMALDRRVQNFAKICTSAVPIFPKKSLLSGHV